MSRILSALRELKYVSNPEIIRIQEKTFIHTIDIEYLISKTDLINCSNEISLNRKKSIECLEKAVKDFPSMHDFELIFDEHYLVYTSHIHKKGIAK